MRCGRLSAPTTSSTSSCGRTAPAIYDAKVARWLARWPSLVRGCHTRHGPYPYCREMRHGVFSVTKSAAGAVVLLRLAQKYGDGVLDEKLVDHLPTGLAHTGWNDVTFAHLLDTSTSTRWSRPARRSARSERRPPSRPRRRRPSPH
jgi:CubicO group peptidase (beta-lactamase class C family)